MKSLIINRLTYKVRLEGGVIYEADIPFRLGLNIIYGPNSVGKSSIIIGIVYGLAAEKSLGIFRNKQNPFKPEFYDNIKGRKVERSYLLLEISNGKDTITIFRNIVGETNLVAVYEHEIEGLELSSDHSKLIASGEGVMAEGGFQYFIFHFLDLPVVEVSKYDGGNSKLYIENIFPLFYVEQQAGWSEIQARQVSRYGIREVKRVVFEYLFRLDKFHIHLKELERRELQESLLLKRRDYRSKKENIEVQVNGKENDDGALIIDKPGQLKVPMPDLIASMEIDIKKLQEGLVNIDSVEEESQKFEVAKKESIKRTDYQIRKKTERVSTLMSEIAGYANYLERIEINRIKNIQLRKINNLGTSLNLSICPSCQQPLDDNEEGSCKLCSKTLKRISTPEENLDFLEDEKKSFEKIITIKKLELRKERAELDRLKERQDQLTEDFEHRINTYLGKDLDTWRSIAMKIDNLKRELGFYQRSWKRWTDLMPEKAEIEKLAKKVDSMSDEIKAYNESETDLKKLSLLVNKFRSNVKSLNLLKNKQEIIDKIRLDGSENYSPYLDEYDLYNITSSSDNVRIILSYYLAMLQTSLLSPGTHFPNLLILDEPRQQNLDEEDLKGFISAISELSDQNYQVILTTYSEGKDRSSFEKFIVREMTNKSDFLLKEVSKK